MVGTRASLKKKKSVLSQSLWLLSSGSFSRASRVSISRTKTACGDGVCGPHRLDRERQMAFLGFLFRSSKNQRAVVKRPGQFLFIKDYTTASWLATATPQTVHTNSWDCSITAPRSWPAIVHADYNSTNFASTGITRRLRRPPWKTIDCLLLSYSSSFGHPRNFVAMTHVIEITHDWPPCYLPCTDKFRQQFTTTIKKKM